MKSRIIDRIGYYIFRLPLYNILRAFSSMTMPKASKENIDVIIPVIPKDLDILPYCLKGLRKNVVNNIKEIYLVGPIEQDIIEFANQNGLRFIDEASVLGFGAKDVNYTTSNGINRSGWLFQQFLKLSGSIGECKNFITIDSDHILIRPHVFLTSDNRFVFYRSQEFHSQYYIANKKLLGKLKIPALSYVAHKMVFNKDILSQLKADIEQRTKLKWTDAIIGSLDFDDSSSFSEFELYANFVSSRQKYYKLWLQTAIYREKPIDILELSKTYNSHLSVTYPAYLQVKH